MNGPVKSTKRVKIDTLQPHPRNPRIGDVEAIASSLETNGQYRAIVVQLSTSFIVAGNHTWKAAKSLGWATILATFVDVDDEAALRIMAADNRAAELATYDEGELQALLDELAGTDLGLAGTVWTDEDLDKLTKAGALEDGIGDADEEPNVAPAKTHVSVGEYRVEIPREAYDEWREAIREDVGYEANAVVAECLRRLGFGREP